jgi:hypothetical protein
MTLGLHFQVVLKAKGPPMRLAGFIKLSAVVVLTGLLSVLQTGCGGGSGAGKASAGPLKDRETIAAALPKGVSLDSAVIPNAMYGTSSKTVEDALANLQAYVRGQAIHDGGLGREIHFERGGKSLADARSAEKSLKKPRGPFTVIMLAD